MLTISWLCLFKCPSLMRRPCPGNRLGRLVCMKKMVLCWRRRLSLDKCRLHIVGGAAIATQSQHVGHTQMR